MWLMVMTIVVVVLLSTSLGHSHKWEVEEASCFTSLYSRRTCHGCDTVEFWRDDTGTRCSFVPAPFDCDECGGQGFYYLDTAGIHEKRTCICKESQV